MAAASQPGNGEKGIISDADRREIKQRLDQLGDKLEDVQARQPKVADDNARGGAMGTAFRLSAEMIAGVVVGGILGFALDTWFGTRPFLLILCLVFGGAAGIFNAIRTAKRMQKQN